MVWKGKTLRRLVQHPSPRGKRVNNRIQSKLLTYCFRYVKEHHTKVFLRLSQRARADFEGELKRPIGAEASNRISERLHRLCFHHVRDTEPELLVKLRREAVRIVWGDIEARAKEDGHGA